MNLEIYSDCSKLKENLLEYFPKNKQSTILSATAIAEKFHRGKKRLIGEPEIIHALATGYKTAEMGLGPKTVSATILHEVLKHEEDREEYSKLIEEKLGKDVLKLVIEVTSMKNQEAEQSGKFTNLSSAQKFLLSSVSDLRVIMVKLAEKYHNLLTIDPHSKPKRDAFLDEMERIYIPLSEYLGLGSIHQQLSDLIFMKKNKMKYNYIKDFIEEKRSITNKTRDRIIEELETVAQMDDIDAKVLGRTKSIASIHNKQKKYLKEGKKYELESIMDVLAFRLIVKSIDDCYKIKGTLTNLFDSIPAEEDDYIANPKPNGYKALHLCLKHPKEGIIEVQIFTESMYFYQAFGPASHIAYKKSGKRYSDVTSEFEWVKKIHKAGMHEDKPIKAELFKDQVFVFTPQKDIIQLPNGATALDFAYNVHTRLGNQCVASIVNGKAVSLDTKLKTGDVIQIRTDNSKKHATEEWLEMVVTDSAKRKIKQSLGKKRHSEL